MRTERAQYPYWAAAPCPAGGGFRDDAADQPGGLSLSAADSRERKLSEWGDARARRLLDGIELRRQQGGSCEVAADCGGLTARVVRHVEYVECPGVAGELRRPGADLKGAVVVPEDVGRPRREETPADHLLHWNVGTRERSDRAPEHGRCIEAAFGEDQREAVQQQITRQRRIRRTGRGSDGTGDVKQAAAGTRQPTRVQRCAPGREIRVAAEADVERLELLRSVEQQQWSVAAGLLEGQDLGPEQIDAYSPEIVERSSLGCLEESKSGIELAGPEAGLGRGERSHGSALGIARQRYRALEKRGGSGQAAARLRPTGRSLELGSNLFVWTRRGRREMPRSPIRIYSRVRRLGERAVNPPTIARSRLPIDDRPHERMTEPQLRARFEQAGFPRRFGRLDPDPKSFGGVRNQVGIPGWIRGRHDHKQSGLNRERRQPPPEALFDAA